MTTWYPFQGTPDRLLHRLSQRSRDNGFPSFKGEMRICPTLSLLHLQQYRSTFDDPLHHLPLTDLIRQPQFPQMQTHQVCHFVKSLVHAQQNSNPPMSFDPYGSLKELIRGKNRRLRKTILHYLPRYHRAIQTPEVRLFKIQKSMILSEAPPKLTPLTWSTQSTGHVLKDEDYGLILIEMIRNLTCLIHNSQRLQHPHMTQR